MYRHEMDAKIDLSKSQSDKSGVFNWDDAQSNDVLMHSFAIQWLRSLEVLFFESFSFDGSEILPKLKSRVRRGWPSPPRMWSWTYTAVFPITRRNFKALRHPVYVGLNMQYD